MAKTKKTKKKAEWTVMVYLAGDNNLTSECMFALTEMKNAVLNEQLNVIAQFDPSDPYLPTHRYKINRSTENGSLYKDIIDYARYNRTRGEVHFKAESRKANSLAKQRRKARELETDELNKASLTDARVDQVITDETDTGSPITLYNFISFCIENYPAKRYLVVLSGHAGGTERDYLLKDESPLGSLTFNELKNVFKRVVKKDLKGKPIDIVGMDNCLMSMAEICYELRNEARIVVGCESYSPTSGWPYRQILERLCNDFVDLKSQKRRDVIEAAAKGIVEEYVNYYANYWMAGLSVTQSALDVRKVEELQRLIDRFAVSMEQELARERDERESKSGPHGADFQDSLVLAHWEAQSYNGEQFVDLYDFCDCLHRRVKSKTIVLRCRELKKFLESEFVLKSCYCGADYQYSYGVSLYFPWSQVAPGYWNLDFVNDTRRGWGSFLRTYTLLTRRQPRGIMGETTLGAAVKADIRNRITFVRMTGERMTGERMTGERMTGERMTGERMTGERMTGERMTGERMTGERMNSGVLQNRIHSMRNPPNVFFPDDCIKDQLNCLAAQDTLRTL